MIIENQISKDYSILYIKLIPNSEKNLWIKYCHIFDSLPTWYKDKIIKIRKYINTKYELKIPLSKDNQNGIIVDSKNINKIAFDIYNSYLKEFSDEFSVRCLYTYGQVTHLGQTIHDSRGDGLIFLGRNLDLTDTETLTKLYFWG